MTAVLLTLDRLDWFRDPRTGEIRELRRPDDPPTARQLLALWHAGALAVVADPGYTHRFPRAQAAYAVAYHRTLGA